MSSDRRMTLLDWFPVLMRYGGFAGACFLILIWLLTDRVEASLLALVGGMMGVGEGIEAIKELSRGGASK